MIFYCKRCQKTEDFANEKGAFLMGWTLSNELETKSAHRFICPDCEEKKPKDSIENLLN